ncbi:MAG: bifunctional metallophosphatase/5'-nucleotidase [Oligoflexia bacterium]
MLKPKLRVAISLVSLLMAWGGMGGCATQSKGVRKTASIENLQTLTILGMNDFHGALLAREFKEPERHTAGGAPVLAQHVRILREKYGENFLILDGGDQFQGTLESNSAEGKPVVEFFNRLGMSAAALGNHEFDFGPEGNVEPGTPGSDLRGALKARMKQAHYPFLAANIRYKNGRELTDFPNLKPSVMLEAGKLKVGVIGLATIHTPGTTKPENVHDLVFTDAAEATLREASRLRKQGAHLVLVLAHQGLKCVRLRPEPSLIRRAKDAEGACENDEEIPALIRAIPKGTIDAVIAGHTHQLVHHYLDGVPVIQSGANGLYYNLLQLTWDWSQNRLVDSETVIEGPIPVCERIFSNQGDCNAQRPAPHQGRGALVTPALRGVMIQPEPGVDAWIKEIAAVVEGIKKQVVGYSVVSLTHERMHEAPLGNFIADAMREGLKADLAVMNPGGIRASIEAGEVRYEDVYRTFPFDNAVVSLELNEKQLNLLLRVIQSGARGYYPVSGIKLTLLDSSAPAQGDDLNGDSKIAPWEINRLVSLTLEDGSPLQADRTYRVAIPDFLVSGGDDLGWVMSQFPKSAIHREGSLDLREAVIAHFKRSAQRGGHGSPRVTFVKSKSR